MKQWITDYIRVQKAAHDSISIDGVAQLIEKLRDALKEDRQIFVFGNGGSAANSSHFATDLGKGASDKVGKRFRVISLNDNVSWITALGNDYAYEDIYVRQLENYGKPGDIALGISVSEIHRIASKLSNGPKRTVFEPLRWSAASADEWEKLPSNPSSSTTRITGGLKMRRWVFVTCSATRSLSTRSGGK